MRRVILVLLAFGGVGCGDETSPPDGGDGGGPIETDSATVCASDGDCDNGDFCDGEETCSPDDPSSDELGCVAASTPCMDGQTCDEEEDRCVTMCPVAEDADGDGVDSIDCGGTDCDDSNASVYPGASEVCDAADLDEDCDPSTFGIRDADGDDEPDGTCCNTDPSDGSMRCGTDCDDTRAGVSPAASEACNSRDDDCDMLVDEDVLDTFYPDMDGDDFGDPNGTAVEACFQPEGYASRNTDCDDTRSGVNPGVGERCDMEMLDENCDMIVNPDSLCMCTDGEARGCTLPGACSSGTETCADGAWGACSIAPVTETCNDVDDDCDGAADEDLTVVCYRDVDNDGYGADGAELSNECPEPARAAVGGCPNFTTNRPPAAGSADCADSDPTRRPGNPELCNTLDDNCDGTVDEGVRVVCYADLDNDTYSPGGMTMECPVSDRAAVGGCPLGTTNRAPGVGSTDCDDGASSIRPGAAETCTTGTSVDEDCDMMVDEGVAVTCYADADGDTYAAAGAAASSRCRDDARPTIGFCPIAYTNRMPTASVNDCQPTNAAIHPGATEACTLPAVDEDCDGTANNPTVCMCGDGEVRACTLPGVCATGTEQCSMGAWGMCSVQPTMEVCDTRDEDCDGQPDDGLTVVCYTDGDNDTYAPSGASPVNRCPVAGRESVGGCPGNYTNRAPTNTSNTDCNDMSSSIRPGATEVCTDSMPAVDEDCDGMLDEMLRVTCYADGDADTYAPSSSGATSRCSDGSRPIVGGCPAGYTNRAPGGAATDCNDGAAAVNPGATEICDRVDSNCSSGGGTATDEDADNDGHAPTAAMCSGGFTRDDCRDDNAAIHPGISETCDRIDSNCSSGGGVATDEDFDGDSHAPPGAACSGGFLRDDCLDTNGSVYPGQTAYFGTPYCVNGVVPNRCGAEAWYCDGGFCPPVCMGCAPLTRATWDYDCSGAWTHQPLQTCTTTVGMTCLGNVCRNGPFSDTLCGENVSWRNCNCGPGPSIGTCGSVTSTTARMGCH